MGVSSLLLDVPTLCGLLHVLPPEDLLHLARLRYLKRFLNSCPPVLWQMLVDTAQAPDSWMQACSSSLQWFRQFYSDHFAAPDSDDLRDWLPLIRLDPSWHGRVRAAGKACRWYRQACAESTTWNKQFDESFVNQGGVLPSRQTIAQERWACDQCEKWCLSKRALASHSARVHGYRHLVLFYATGEVCHSCCRWYHNRSRLVEHLRDATRCMETLQACFPPISEEQLAAYDMEEHAATAPLKRDGWGATKALCPMQRVHAPSLPPPASEEAKIMRDKYAERLASPGHGFARLQGRREAPAQQESRVHLFAEDFPAFVFNTPEGLQLGNGRYDQAGLAREYAMLHVRSLVFVHFFSGYRREQDLHQQLEHRSIAPGLEIFVISVDLCLQREQGNLVSPAAHAFWARHIRSGQVVGAGGGPPCETYSAARQQDDGPRALRSEAFPWGLPSLKPREWKQVLVGTRLLHFLLSVILLLAQVGGCGFCEHPQFPTWLLKRGPASIWLHPAIRPLRLLRCIGITSFDQCFFGADATKPTTVPTSSGLPKASDGNRKLRQVPTRHRSA